MVKSSCKFGNNGFFSFFGKDIYIYIYIFCVCILFFFFPFLVEAVREVGGLADLSCTQQPGGGGGSWVSRGLKHHAVR